MTAARPRRSARGMPPRRAWHPSSRRRRHDHAATRGIPRAATPRRCAPGLGAEAALVGRRARQREQRPGRTPARARAGRRRGSRVAASPPATSAPARSPAAAAHARRRVPRSRPRRPPPARASPGEARPPVLLQRPHAPGRPRRREAAPHDERGAAPHHSGSQRMPHASHSDRGSSHPAHRPGRRARARRRARRASRSPSTSGRLGHPPVHVATARARRRATTGAEIRASAAWGGAATGAPCWEARTAIGGRCQFEPRLTYSTPSSVRRRTAARPGAPTRAVTSSGPSRVRPRADR